MNESVDIQTPSAKVNKSLQKGWRYVSIIFVFWYALLGWLRFISGMHYQSNFIQLKIWPRPLYIILSGLSIGIGFSVALALILIRVKFTPLYIRILGFLFLAWLWIDQIWIATRNYFFYQAILPTAISIITIILIFVFIRSKDYQMENKI